MKDLKIDDWFGWAWSAVIDGLPSPAKTPALRPVTDAFAKNVERCIGMSRFPTALFFRGRRLELARVAACMMLLGKPNYEAGDFSKGRGQINTLTEQLYNDRITPPFTIAVAGNADDAYRYAFEGDRPVFETLMSMQVVAAWTAFETLAGDLWEAAVNCHPKGLAQLAGKMKKQEKRPEGKADQGRMMPFSLLEKYGFNVGSVMGSIQRDMEKVGFNTLDKVRSAYVAAFADELPLACKILDDQAFYNLALVRNVIVHCAGRCDKEYQTKSEGRPPLPQLAIGEELSLDGVLVRDLVAPALKGCVRLIQTIDGWLDGRLSPFQQGGGI